jgi:hypothetical protein
MRRLFLTVASILMSASFLARADEMPPAPDPSVLVQHVKKVKPALMTPEKLFEHIAKDVEAGKPAWAFAHFSPSDTNWESLVVMSSKQRKEMAAAFRRARPAKTLSERAKTYEVPFEGQGQTLWNEVGLSQGPDGAWSIYSW